MKTLKYILLSCVVLGAVACDDFLVETPDTSVEKSGVYNSLSSAKAALAGCYGNMAGYNGYAFNYFHVLSVTSGMGVSIKANDVNLTTMNILPSDVNMTNAYNGMYETVRIANDIIDGMKSSTISVESEKNRITGEAHFIRGLTYFNLVRLFGKVSLVTQPVLDYNEAQAPRADVSAVYTLIIDDLKAAYGMLPLPADKVEGHPHRYAAQALLAKVYLTLAGNTEGSEYWQKAYDAAKDVYDHGEYKLVRPYAKLFGSANKNNAESIFEIQFKRNTPGVSGSNYNGYYRPPFVNINGWVGYGDDPVTRNHYECYEEGDLRRDINVRLYTKEEYPNMSSNYEFPCYVNKFQDPSPLAVRSQGGENNYPILRYSDVYLMRAEALNAINTSDAEAYECLNVIRRRAFGLNMNEASAIDIKPGLSKEDFLDVILLERRKEFAFEGQRRFDLVRTHKLKEAMMAQNPTIGAVVEEKHYLLPIPVTELDANKLLEQTPGW